MQNYYDVLLRRFMAVGDAIFESGNGGKELERYKQLDALTKTLYVMSQDSPECAGAVWSRRLGILQKGTTLIVRVQYIIFFYDFDTYFHCFTNQRCLRGYETWKSLHWVMLVRMNLLLGHRPECCS